jgi:hypothetical protein
VQLTRRQWLQATGAFAAALAIGPRIARGAELKTVRFGIGQKAMAPNVINCVIGEVLGYNKEENFTVKPQALGGNSNVQVAVERGDVDIGIGVPSFGLPLLAKGEWGSAINYYEYTYPYKWDIVVKPGSPLKSYADLKGKKVGVSDFAGTEYPVTRNVLKSLQIDPDKDVKWVAVGNGVPAGVALDRGAIDALAYYDTGFGQIEAAGIGMQFLPRPKDLPMVGGQFLMRRNRCSRATARCWSASAAPSARRRDSCSLIRQPARRLSRDVPGNRTARQLDGGRRQGGARRDRPARQAVRAALSERQDGQHQSAGVQNRGRAERTEDRRLQRLFHQRVDRRHR